MQSTNGKPVYGKSYDAKRYADGSSKKGAVATHILLAEKALGRKLPKGAVVHHADGNPYNNNSANLVVCPSQAYHRLLHTRLDAWKACGNANFRRCYVCKTYDDPVRMSVSFPNGSATFCHAACRRAYRQQFKELKGRKV